MTGVFPIAPATAGPGNTMLGGPDVSAGQPVRGIVAIFATIFRVLTILHRGRRMVTCTCRATSRVDLIIDEDCALNPVEIKLPLALP